MGAGGNEGGTFFSCIFFFFFCEEVFLKVDPLVTNCVTPLLFLFSIATIYSELFFETKIIMAHPRTLKNKIRQIGFFSFQPFISQNIEKKKLDTHTHTHFFFFGSSKKKKFCSSCFTTHVALFTVKKSALRSDNNKY